MKERLKQKIEEYFKGKECDGLRNPKSLTLNLIDLLIKVPLALLIVVLLFIWCSIEKPPCRWRKD